MIKIKFIQFYINLKKSVKKDFKKFVLSGYFCNGRDFSGFLQAVDKYTGKSQNARDMIKDLSSELSLSNRSVWNRLYELTSIAEKYIFNKELYSNELLFNNLICSYYINENEYGLFNRKINYSKKKFSLQKKGPDSNYLYYQLLQQQGNYYIYQNKNEPFILNLTEQVIYHSASYIINHYLHLTELLQQRNLTSEDLSEKGLNFLTDFNTENFINTLKENYYELYCQVSFHYNIYKAFLLRSDESYYKTALKFFKLLTGSVNDNYRSMFYQLLINYCILKTNNNEHSYYHELFHLYNNKLNEGLLRDLEVGNFPINNFRDYIFVALQLGKIDWIKHFIEKYSGYLPLKVREDEINLSYGIVYYHESDNSNAIAFLNKVAGENYIHYMDSKYYKLRLYYDTESYEEAILEVDNYKHYLKAHKEIPESFAKPYKSFIKEYTVLLNSKLKNKTEDAEILLEQLKSKNQTPRRKWIMRNLNELIDKT